MIQVVRELLQKGVVQQQGPVLLASKPVEVSGLIDEAATAPAKV